MDYRSLQVWELAHQLVLQVYRLTLQFPKEEAYPLTQQIRRATISAPSIQRFWLFAEREAG